MFFRIRYTTRYSYEKPAYDSQNDARLAPNDGRGQRCIVFNLEVDPPAEISEYKDAFGNRAHSISIEQPHRKLTIVADSIVERTGVPPDPTRFESFADYLMDDQSRTMQYRDFLESSRYVPFSDRLRKFFWSVRPQMSEDVANYATRIIGIVRDQFGYDLATTHVHSTVDDILTAGGGVCQDFAHLTIGLFRLAGVPVRYVSGYLAPNSANDPKAPPPELASHAWIEILLPGIGWTGFDPTHRMPTTLRHIRVAIGRDYGDIVPIRGAYQSAGGKQVMSFELELLELSEKEACASTPIIDPGKLLG
jgi:transglutaminase-like putative cysteine protease